MDDLWPSVTCVYKIYVPLCNGYDIISSDIIISDIISSGVSSDQPAS